MEYEDQLIREMTAGEDKWCSRCERTAEDCDCLSRTESFTQWLDAQGDSLPLPESFTQWLDQTGDKI